jgi:hypothetical protein
MDKAALGQVFSVSAANHSTDCSTLTIIIRGWYNRPYGGRRECGFSLAPPTETDSCFSKYCECSSLRKPAWVCLTVLIGTPRFRKRNCIPIWLQATFIGAGRKRVLLPSCLAMLSLEHHRQCSLVLKQMFTEQVSSGGSDPNSFSESVQFEPWAEQRLYWDFHGFPQSHQINIWILSEISPPPMSSTIFPTHCLLIIR